MVRGVHLDLRSNVTYELNGEIHYWRDLSLVRVEFAPHHKLHGEIVLFKEKESVCRLYAPNHKRHGEVLFYKDGKAHRQEHQRTHELHGQILFFKRDGYKDRSEFSSHHKFHGQIIYYKNQDVDRMEFASTHYMYGEIHFATLSSKGTFKYCHAEYAEHHPNHGEILFFINDDESRIEFTSTHANHGEICFYRYSKCIRIEYNDIILYKEEDSVSRMVFRGDHKHAGEILFFKGDEHSRTEYGPGHWKHGEVDVYTEGKGPHTNFTKSGRRFSLREFEEYLYLRDIRLKYDQREEELVKQRQHLEIERRRSISEQRDAKRGARIPLISIRLYIAP